MTTLQVTLASTDAIDDESSILEVQKYKNNIVYDSKHAFHKDSVR